MKTWIMVCVDLVGPFTIMTPSKTHSLPLCCTHNDRSMKTPLVGLKLLKPQISRRHPSRIYFITPGWHVMFTLDLNLLSLTTGANPNVSSNKCICVTIMALKPKQLQITTYHPQQTNAIIDQVHKVVNNMLRSFDLENNHENLEEQEDNLFDFFLQLTAWLPSY
jgi:hypothetical protein